MYLSMFRLVHTATETNRTCDATGSTTRIQLKRSLARPTLSMQAVVGAQRPDRRCCPFANVDRVRHSLCERVTSGWFPAAAPISDHRATGVCGVL